MKTLFSLFILLIGGAALAQAATNQPSASHEVTINIPNVLMLRLVDGNAPVADPFVTFDFVTDFETYLDIVDDGGGELEPTDSNFTDIIVFSNRENWQVDVEATDFTDPGLALNRISVIPSGSLGNNIWWRANNFVLSTNATEIANGPRTQGWRSLGISGSDYRLAVDGTEAPGTYTTTVTYTISAP